MPLPTKGPKLSSRAFHRPRLRRENPLDCVRAGVDGLLDMRRYSSQTKLVHEINLVRYIVRSPMPSCVCPSQAVVAEQIGMPYRTFSSVKFQPTNESRVLTPVLSPMRYREYVPLPWKAAVLPSYE
jgi:hypothetical protein